MLTTSKMLAVLTLLAAAILAPARAESVPPGVTQEQVENAKTPADHQAIADAYAKEAESLRAQATQHRHMDSWYNEPGYRSHKTGLVRHCRALVQQLEAAAKDADALAAEHHAMAERAAKTKP